MDDCLALIMDEVDLLVAELKELHASRLHFRIYHRFHKPGTVCAPGEEIFAACLVHRGREFYLRLSLALRILFDYLARHSHLPQSAAQIEAGIRGDRYYVQHASNVLGSSKLIRSIPRSYVRVYIERLRTAIDQVLNQAGLLIDSRAVLLTEATVMNETGYRLRVVLELVHIEI
jgi:hypothetical protein